MKENRERLAWTVLLIAFVICMALLLGVPFGIYQWIQHATVPPHMVLRVLEGTAQVEASLVLAGNEPTEIQPGAAITNYAETETPLTISSPDEAYTLGTVQIYPDGSHPDFPAGVPGRRPRSQRAGGRSRPVEGR